MAQVGSEWLKCVRYVLDVFVWARAVRNGCRIFEGRSNMHAVLQTNIERDNHTSLSEEIELRLA